MRILRRGGLSREQENLLAEHEGRGGDWVGALVGDVSRLQNRRWEQVVAEGGRFASVSPWKTPTGERLAAEPPKVAVSVVVAAARRRTYDLALALARRKLEWTADDVVLLLALARLPQKKRERPAVYDSDDKTTQVAAVLAVHSVSATWELHEGLRVALAAAERLPADLWTVELGEALERAHSLVERDNSPGYETDRTKLLARIRKLLGDEDRAELDLAVLGTDDELGKPLRRALEKRWRDDPHAGALLAHLAQATTGTTPPKKWQERARELLVSTREGDELLRTILAHALEAKDGRRAYWGGNVYQWIDDRNAVLVRGAVWAAGAVNPPWATHALADLGEHAASSFEGGYEPRSIKVANACIRQLGALGSDDAVAALAQLKARIKHKTIGKQVEQALEDAAGATGMTKGELLERQVPTFGLDADGRKELHLGTALAIVERDELHWESNGKPVKSVPKAVKEVHASELRVLRAELKEIKKALAAERVRVESLFAEERTWDFEDWRRLYLEHPLTGAYARRLIWVFGDDAAFPLDDGFVRADGSPVEPDGDVRLWHPIDAPVEDVAAWRAFLLEREQAQPFKQAYREVYFVAPAELETRTYSNRFAAHILHYRQAYALIRSRGWSVVALGPYDNDGGRQWRDFDPYGIRGAFWMGYIDEDWDGESMIASLAATDQVRFEPIGGGDPIPIADVPPRVFSETMRDVDLFVGVSSIAADPQWVDQGDRHLGYWREHSFGELTESAQTRREVLGELVPQLKIADRLELDDRYLRVRGKLREYKIHLGSANILMEPNDEYLCIVPERGKTVRNVFLPFEDDTRLSVILSKAFLLADDGKIADETILQQIRR